MTVTITKTLFDEMTAHAKSRLPEEACGLIAGVRKENQCIVQEIYCLTNIDHTSEHFSLDPKEQLSAVKDELHVVL